MPRAAPRSAREPSVREVTSREPEAGRVPQISEMLYLGMASKISTMEVREKLGEYLDRVALRHDQFVIDRKGKPLASPPTPVITKPGESEK